MEEGIRLYNEGKYREALDVFLNLNVETDEYTELAYHLGLCYTKLRQYDEAVLYLEQVVTSDEAFATAYQSRMILGYIYSITERHRLAEFEFSRLIEDGYESPKAYAALAYTQYHQKNIAAAVRNLQKAIAMDPDNVTALNNIGFILAEEGSNPDIALRYCRRAVDRSPENPSYLDSLGWAYLKCGRFSEARGYLKKALRLRPDDLEIQNHVRVLEKKEAR
ncbi:MAG: tetratricopeptide repeat protein [Spirochaetaceae bacterium]|nr:MAG: tetratricopeptide repeat protein [Spirochaetaceae bacterium]